MCYTFELWWHVNADNPTGYLCHVDTYVSKDIHSHLISQNESRAGLLTVFSGAEHSRLLWNTGEYWKNRKGKQTFVVVLIPSSTVCFVNGTKNVITSIWRKDSVKGQRAELVCFHTPIESNSIPPEWDGFHPEWTGSYTVLPAELWAQAFIQQVHPLIPFLTFTLLWMQTLVVWILPKGFWQPGVDSTFWATATPLIQFLKKAVWHALNLSNLIWYQYLQYGQVSLHWQCYFSQS